MSMKITRIAVWEKGVSKLATKIADHLPGLVVIGGAGKIADMIWIREIFRVLISFQS